MHQNGYEFDLCYTSVLTRAIQTFNYAAEELDCHYIPVVKDWRLNERHYGALQGLNKLETVEKHGKDQVQIWRRSYDIPPPELEANDPRHPSNDKRYRHLKPEELPRTESLKTTIDRVLPFWNNTIVPSIKSGKRVLVVAHGNSLRAIVKVLSNVSESCTALLLRNNRAEHSDLDSFDLLIRRELRSGASQLPGRSRVVVAAD